MPDHRIISGALPWYATGKLDDAEGRQVQEHLGSCDDCGGQLEQIRGFAELGAETPTADALEHVAPGLLVEYAEDRAGLDGETVSWIEGRLAQCTTCREAYDNLQTVEAALRVEAASPAPYQDRMSSADGARARGESSLARLLWDWLSATLLRPAPALAYLLVAAVGLPFLWTTRAPGHPIATVQIVTVTGERVTREGSAALEPSAIQLDDAGQPVLIELFTDLQAEDLRPGAMAFIVELSTGGRTVWSQPRDAGALVLRDGRGVLSLVLDPRALRLDQDYRLSIRVERPGDPLHGQALFVRHLRFHGK